MSAETGALVGDSAVLEATALPALIQALRDEGYEVIGPTARDGAIVFSEYGPADSLPVGYEDSQEGGRYRLIKTAGRRVFDYVVGPKSLKEWFWPPRQPLWTARRGGRGSYTIDPPDPKVAPRRAFVGVRACDLAAMAVNDRTFDNGDFADPAYLKRRDNAIFISVDCARPAATCFCASMNTGPRSSSGFDLALTELEDADTHVFLVRIGTEAGAKVVARVPHRLSVESDLERARAVVTQAVARMERSMVPGIDALLKRNFTHPRWTTVAERCLSCGNCTMVCPTCFCSDVKDHTSLTGDVTTRVRSWDSCFTLDHSYVHGGALRQSRMSRYRQWMTHKLSSWWDQFGVSGCTGCGRCITWCPVGIDITEEARAIAEGDLTQAAE
ncbi:4Fe-4S dicluster domain-containing protein [Consotaella salsifontis]|uniref:4Fe-4S dicluster containing protein n=1 Tax=Consotaella salsifontis TaxID=1365950 RepID=A0A1T4SHZ0_9HYPH|nr:4Fe-4S dicluster domain-containing protein [Consotaella salsifontis]SKA27799.1 4Fe-4S dicluster containing protein [Consotaella salsifontis]